MSKTLGEEISRLRTKAGITLRKFAERIEVSAPHLSDIEHDRRRPSNEVMERMAKELAHVGATYEGFDLLNSRLDPEMQRWVAKDPTIREMLRTVKDSNRSPREILNEIQRVLGEPDGKKG